MPQLEGAALDVVVILVVRDLRVGAECIATSGDGDILASAVRASATGIARREPVVCRVVAARAVGVR